MMSSTSSLRRLLLTVGCLPLLIAPAVADRFTLTSGGEIEGQLLSETDTHYRVRTFVGQVELDKADVTQHEPGDSIFDEYDRRLAKASNDADALVMLADWCGDNGLSQERRQHLEQALQLNPNHAAARAALGYTRVGNLWIESETVLESEAQRQNAAERAQREAERETRLKLSELKQELFNIEQRYFTGFAREQTQGEAELKAFSTHDPLAMTAMFNYLKGHAPPPMRAKLVEVFADSTDPQTTLYIVYAALKDPSAKIRDYAIDELFTRNTNDVVNILAAALDIKSDTIKSRAAELIGDLNSQEAIPALIENLVGRRMKWIEIAKGNFEVSNHRYLTGLAFQDNEGDARNEASQRPVYYTTLNPILGAPITKRSFCWMAPLCGPITLYQTESHLEEVPVYHTAVRDALRDLTGEDFGFDQKAWTDWHEQQRPNDTNNDIPKASKAQQDSNKDSES